MNTLKEIEANYKNYGVDRCFLECLQKWLSKSDKAEAPSGVTLSAALRGINEVSISEVVLEISKHNIYCFYNIFIMLCVFDSDRPC